METFTDVLNVPPMHILGSHRLQNAIGLSLSMYTSASVMQLLTGVNLRQGNLVPKTDYPEFLQKFHGLLEYKPGNDDPKHRWMSVAHMAVPLALGAYGAFLGSTYFFKDKAAAAQKAEYIEDYVDSIAFQESWPWRIMAGFSAIFGAKAGFVFLPFNNYGVNLHTGFGLAYGRKVALPGLGTMWSGNQSTLPYNTKELLDRMINYAARNKSENPEQLERFSHAILTSLFRDVKAEDIYRFTNEFHKIRDQHMKAGGVPEYEIKACVDDLCAHFTKEGLEKTLISIGKPILDEHGKLNVDIDQNGLSGRIAKILRERGDVDKKVEEYRVKAVKRMKERQKNQDGFEKRLNQERNTLHTSPTLGE
jgi:hypothetical protein